MKKTVVIGASPNADRYSYRAVRELKRHGHEVIPVGMRQGLIEGISIHTDRPLIEHVDTISLYVGPANQPSWYDYMLDLNPRRIIFNPGTENPEFEKLARDKGIQVEIACTLVLLAIGSY